MAIAFGSASSACCLLKSIAIISYIYWDIMGTFISQYIVKLQIPIGRISVPPFQKQPFADVLQTEHEPIAMKALMILPTLMLQ